MASNAISFPSPVGGVPFPSDFVPSLIFAGLYASLIPLIIYRVVDKRSRNTLLLNSIAFAIERIVVFSLRAVQARDLEKRESKGLNAYMQSTLGLGFVSMTQGLITFTGCFLVSTTKVSEGITPHDVLPTERAGVSESKGAYFDRFRMRRRFRGITNYAYMVVTAALIIGTIAGSRYGQGITNTDVGNQINQLRYVSCAITLSLAVSMGSMMGWARRRFTRVRRDAACILAILTVLISTIAIYRLVVMANTTTSLIATDSASLNSPAAKTVFYVLHILPEWIWMVILFGFNARDVFETGPYGLYVDPDEPKEDGIFTKIRNTFKKSS